MGDGRSNISELRSAHPKLAQNFDRLIDDLIKHHLIGSTLVEGSTFTEEEALEVLLSGKTIHGHSIDEHQELINGREAASYIHRLFFESCLITTALLDRAHSILFNGVGDPKKNNPGKNRGLTGKAAYTVVVKDEKPLRISYERPAKVKNEYGTFIEHQINSPLPETRAQRIAQLARMYFHFQMLHPYSDGNGRLGRLLVSAKAATDAAWFFRFEKKDGPEHLRTMVALTLSYVNKEELNYSNLEAFLDSHLENYD